MTMRQWRELPSAYRAEDLAADFAARRRAELAAERERRRAIRAQQTEQDIQAAHQAANSGHLASVPHSVGISYGPSHSPNMLSTASHHQIAPQHTVVARAPSHPAPVHPQITSTRHRPETQEEHLRQLAAVIDFHSTPFQYEESITKGRNGEEAGGQPSQLSVRQLRRCAT